MLAAITLTPKLFITVVGIGMIICIAIILLVPSKKKETSAEPEEEESNELTATPAVVVSKRIDDDYTGTSKKARHNVAYLVTFLVEGEEREILVDRLTFERVNEGDSSTLVMEGKNFFDFSDGEEMTDEERAAAEAEALEAEDDFDDEITDEE